MDVKRITAEACGIRLAWRMNRMVVKSLRCAACQRDFLSQGVFSNQSRAEPDTIRLFLSRHSTELTQASAIPRASIDTFVSSRMALLASSTARRLRKLGPTARAACHQPRQYYAILRYDTMASLDRLQPDRFFCL